ncbi:MAG: protoporphyrinogen oxidase HemJ [Hoeflea sp.]|uniref:protoporphyrinogen oxidase HemJ n=1 Tax=Hoeflea sp. TaxID=1940281 RepID=UPI001DA5E738|nr:protoporphyrinogen oxidase HemJ [Hoeflea sp.]MBU4531783.1 protoporphyrinogen oxidase HemJ [Alphaproteobacteria bacterium]MBU4544639.1 protoporphyrinogen oxidase HemJ [Alphaproteobacteria bacterium]MBU4552870.1 protoporphyrinogen oxidase HemJ [Alphaproteobacteria bacterium]MBV1725059.1 protoporphyrinogen oxidase HemJ [Hoeflea sp.]MBV1761079.1 protoporphyrinogen oxidase HemJ [Hoeflea sp.]
MSDKATSASEGSKARLKAYVSVGAVVILALLAWWFDPDWLYGWLKVLHVVAVISWMVGLFYLPRLFVYHADAPTGSEPATTFVVMEQRLVKVIMTPAMMVSWVVGLWLAWSGFGFLGLWLWIKIAGVVGLTVFHVYLSRAARKFAAGQNTMTARQWRMANEIPTVLMIVVIIMVIIKPFA